MAFGTTPVAIARTAVLDATTAGAKASAAAAAREHAAYLAHLYSMEYWETIGGVIGVLAILHVAALVSSWANSTSNRKASLSDTEKGPSTGSPPSSVVRLWRALKSFINILLYRVRIPFQSIHNLGNLAEILCVFSYMGACIAWALMNTPDVRLASNWSSRAGLMAATQVPFIIALAGKNNVISFLTGLSHEKLNVIHRAAGRTVFIISWTHFGGKLWGFLNVYHEAPFAQTDFKWGLVALIGLTLAALSSFRKIRNLSYELFLMSHIVFIFVFVLGIMYHVPQVKTYVYPGFIFWAFDRCARLCRLVFLNLISSPSTPESAPKSTIERLSNDTVRLSVRRSRNILSTWKPGQHFFVVAPGISNLPWEAHPFTAASISHAIDGSSETDVEINFVIRGRDGFTGKLLKSAIKHESLAQKATSSAILVDGPYGQPPDLGIFDTAILIAGGSGVSYTLSMLLGRIHQARLGKGRTSRVLFIWTIRDASHINWIAPALHAALDAQPNVQHPLGIDIRIFITQGGSRPSQSLDRALTEKKSEQSITALYKMDSSGSSTASAETLVQVVRGGGGNVSIESGRPDVRKLIEEELAASDGLKVSVDVAGPGTLAGSVKSTLASSSFASPAAALRGGPSVTLHTETFGW